MLNEHVLKTSLHHLMRVLANVIPVPRKVKSHQSIWRVKEWNSKWRKKRKFFFLREEGSQLKPYQRRQNIIVFQFLLKVVNERLYVLIQKAVYMHIMYSFTLKHNFFLQLPLWSKIISKDYSWLQNKNDLSRFALCEAIREAQDNCIAL